MTDTVSLPVAGFSAGMWKGAFSLPASNCRGSVEKLDGLLPGFFLAAMDFLVFDGSRIA
jgi:hypothetical protein